MDLDANDCSPQKTSFLVVYRLLVYGSRTRFIPRVQEEKKVNGEKELQSFTKHDAALLNAVERCSIASGPCNSGHSDPDSTVHSSVCNNQQRAG
jgi:hypothetical protein